MYCKNCGTKISDNAKFCKYCGGIIKSKPYSNVSEEPILEKSKSKLDDRKNKRGFSEIISEKMEKVELRKNKKNKLREIENRRNQVQIKYGAYKALIICGICLCIGFMGIVKGESLVMILGLLGLGSISIGVAIRDDFFLYEENAISNVLFMLGAFLLCMTILDYCEPSIFIIVLVASFILSLIVGVTMLIYASHKKALLNLYDSEVNHLGNTNLEKLALKLDKPYKKICADLQDMINKEFFIGSNCDIVAYIDQERHLLVMTRDGEPLVPIEDLAEEFTEAENEGLGILEEYINVIEESIKYAESLGDDKTKTYLEDLQKSTRRILNRKNNNTELESSQAVIKWQNNYLPKTIKLIETYMDDTASKSTLIKIKEMLKTCAESFMNLDEKLAQSEDVETLADIEVLKTTFARDVISDSDFDIVNE